MRVVMGMVLAASVAGCDSPVLESAQACVDAHPIVDDTDLHGDDGDTPHQVQWACEDGGGTQCDIGRWNIGYDAAFCIAREALGDSPDLTVAGLWYRAEYEHPYWYVRGTQGHEVYVGVSIDAVTGEVLDQYQDSMGCR